MDKMGWSRRRFSGAVSLAVTGTFLGHGIAGAQDKPLRVAFANLSDDVPFTAAVVAGLRAEAQKRRNITLTFFDNKADPSRSVENARLITSSGFDVYINFGVSAAANAQIARIARTASIPTVAVSYGMEGAPLYRVDNVQAGTVSGKALTDAAKARWPGVEPIAIVSGSPEMGPTAAERATSAKQAIEQSMPGIKVQEISNRNDLTLMRQLATDTLTRYPDRKIIFWTQVDAVALACVAAIRNSRRERDALVSTVGGETAAFPEIRKPGSPLVGTFAVFPEHWGTDLLDLAEQVAAHRPVPEFVTPKLQMFLDAGNIDKHYPA